MKAKRVVSATVAAALVAAGSVAALSGSAVARTAHKTVPTVTLMVGGIDKQIYLPYQLAQDLGYYKKFGVKVVLSTEQQGGVGAEDAMASGQVDMAGAWYVHTIDFQMGGKNVEDIVQLSGAPGERIMCKNGSGIHSPAQFKSQNIGVTDLGSGGDDLVRYLAARQGVTTADFTRVAVGEGSTLLAAMQQGKVACAITTEPTITAVEKEHIGYSGVDVATSAGTKHWLGEAFPTAGVLAQTSWVNSHKAAAQAVVTALVATMHWMSQHSAAQIAAKMPAAFVSNSLISRADYIKALGQDKSQFLSDGMMPTGGEQNILKSLKVVGKVTKPVKLGPTWTPAFVKAAHKQLGY